MKRGYLFTSAKSVTCLNIPCRLNYNFAELHLLLGAVAEWRKESAELKSGRFTCQCNFSVMKLNNKWDCFYSCESSVVAAVTSSGVTQWLWPCFCKVPTFTALFPVLCKIPLVEFFRPLLCEIPLVVEFFRPLLCEVPLVVEFFRPLLCEVPLVEFFQPLLCEIPLVEFLYLSHLWNYITHYHHHVPCIYSHASWELLYVCDFPILLGCRIDRFRPPDG